MSEIPDLGQIADRLRAHQPFIAPPIEDPTTATTPAGADEHAQIRIRRAAVALVIVPGVDGPELLFIERSRREGDYWSGDIAFPGGRSEVCDPDIEATARRETAEEVGVELPDPATRLDDFDTRSAHRAWQLVVTPFAYLLDERPVCTRNHEVEDVIWAPLRRLVDPAASARHSEKTRNVSAPAIRFDDHRVVWGMTHCMLEQFLAAIRVTLPEESRSKRA